MLTGDENIIDIDFAVFWQISNAVAYLFNTRNPAARRSRRWRRASMREVIGRTPIQPALTELRAQIETDVLRQTQQILDNYKAGVEITQVQLQKVDPPAEVIESFLRRAARQHRRRAAAQRGRGLPQRHRAARPRRCGAHRRRRAGRATGLDRPGDRPDAALPVACSRPIRQAKDVTLRRMYIETMQDILTHSPTLVVDDRLKGLVPFLPLNLPQPRPARPRAAAGAARRGRSTSAAGSTAMSRVSIAAHRRARGPVRRWSQRHAVHRRSDRAGADHPVRPAGAGDQAARACTPRRRSSRR